MEKVSKVLSYYFCLAVGVYIFTLIWKPALPKSNEINVSELAQEPIQEEINEKPFTLSFDKVTYELEPLYNYEFSGLVVTQNNSNSFTDVSHYDDPANTKDLCVVWGENLVNGAYQKVQYESGDFTCFVRWNKPIEPPFILNSLGNNHVIPATKEVSEQINSIKIGDQIKLKGKLVNYKVSNKQSEVIFNRNTSITREDTGNGACEIVYVETLDIIKRGNVSFYTVQNIAFWSGIGSLLFLVLGSFIPHS